MTPRLLVTCVVSALALLASAPAARAEPVPDISPELNHLPVDDGEDDVACAAVPVRRGAKINRSNF